MYRRIDIIVCAQLAMKAMRLRPLERYSAMEASDSWDLIDEIQREWNLYQAAMAKVLTSSLRGLGGTIRAPLEFPLEF